MSLFGTMKTSVSGMTAQANRLGTVSDNIANASTTGYKRASTEFSSLVLPSTGGAFSSGGAESSTARAVSEQGSLSYTTSDSDLAVSGDGFFVVQDPSGTPLLTRDGSFQQNETGQLVNSAGFTLMGYSFEGGEPGVVVNSFDGLVPVTVAGGGLSASPSTEGVFSVNLPANAETVGGAVINLLPSENSPFSTYSHHVRTEDDGGSFGSTITDIYFTKTADSIWEVTAYADWSGSGSTFPYDLESGDVSMRSTTLTFDPTTGLLLSGNPVLSFEPEDPSALDFSSLTETAGGLGTSPGTKQSWNMPSDFPAIDTAGGEQPASTNTASSLYASKTTITGYMGTASSSKLDVYLTKV